MALLLSPSCHRIQIDEVRHVRVRTIITRFPCSNNSVQLRIGKALSWHHRNGFFADTESGSSWSQSGKRRTPIRVRGEGKNKFRRVFAIADPQKSKDRRPSSGEGNTIQIGQQRWRQLPLPSTYKHPSTSKNVVPHSPPSVVPSTPINNTLRHFLGVPTKASSLPLVQKLSNALSKTNTKQSSYRQLEGLSLLKKTKFFSKSVHNIIKLFMASTVEKFGMQTGANTKQILEELLKRPLPKKLNNNPYLSGNYGPVEDECVDNIECQVFGSLPSELQGVLLRNGSNPQFPPQSDDYHWFDGDGMVHAVRLDGKTASYSSHYIRTTGWREERAMGRMVHKGLGQRSSPGHMRIVAASVLGLRVQDVPSWCGVKNVANTNLVMHAGRLFALWEAGYPYELDPNTLTTRGVTRLDGALKAPFAAHPKTDPITGELMFFGCDLMRGPYLSYGVMDKEGKVIHHTDIQLPEPIMMHDFAITENFTIFLDLSVRFQFAKLMETRGSAKPFVFDEKKTARIGVMPRFGRNKDVQWFTVKKGFVLHTLNAYEEDSGNTIVLQAFRYDAFSALSMVELESRLDNSEVTNLYEYRMNLQSGKATEQILSQVCSEFPAININYLGRKNRYGYSCRFTIQPGPGKSVPKFDAILKHDLHSNTTQAHAFGPRRYGGEAVFVPRNKTKGKIELSGTKASTDHLKTIFEWFRNSGRNIESGGTEQFALAAQEDDGWLLSHVWDEETKRSEVIIVDATNFKAPPMARIVLPKRVPYGFHGIFVPASQEHATTSDGEG